jgi:Fic family protein
VDALMPCLDAFERFIHAETSDIPPLIKAGLLHVQFESIHPFLDGNGRLGRLLITLFLCAAKVMRQPLLYLSLYLRRNRSTYYRLLQEVREHGAWEAWLEFFLDGVVETADQAFDTATRITALFAADRVRLGTAPQSRTMLRLHELLQTSPYLTAPQAKERLGLTMPTVNRALAELQRLGIVEEVTGRKRGRVYCYRAYMEILGEDRGL